MSAKGRRRGRTIPALIACFYAGVAAGWWIHAAAGRDEDRRRREPVAASTATTGRLEPAPEASPPTGTAPAAAVPRPEDGPERSPGPPTIGADPVAELRRRGLLLPLAAADVAKMEGGFGERRAGGARAHEAVDLLAPRHTPVRAVDDGTVARLFVSQAGGITIYQYDPTERFCYYYAHLERYAPGLRDGARVSKGEVIGYVGTTGNAPPDTPHLHFAIFQLTDARRWWEGRPLDPYQVFRP